MNKIGLVAGAGKFPVIFAEEARRNGCEVYVAGLRGAAAPELEKIASACEYFKVGQIGASIKFLKSHGVDKAVMVGLVRHNKLFGNIMPDLRAAAILARARDMRAENLLREIIAEFAKDGIEFVSSATFLSHLLPEPGFLVGDRLTDFQKKNITLGWEVAKTLSGLDVGLTAVMCDKAVVAVEAMEGTDECILRAGQIYAQALAGGEKEAGKGSGLVVVKVARPKQDFRFDLPVIGVNTVKNMARAQAPLLVIEAGSTILLEKEALLAAAKAAGITILALKDGKI